MRSIMVLSLCFCLASCAEPEAATYFYGYDLEELQSFVPQDTSEGIYPSLAVLDNPRILLFKHSPAPKRNGNWKVPR